MMRPVVASYAYALVVALVMGHFLFGIPVQFSDSYGNMLKLDKPWADLIADEFRQQAFLRPMLWAPFKAVYDASDGNYFVWYRSVHAAQVGALVLLCVGLMRPRTWLDAAVLPLGLAMLLAMHTFSGAIVEAFPVNGFLTLLLCCAGAAHVALARYRWWNDLAAVLLLAFAALTAETGLLVGVIFAAGYLVGARGISRTGLGGVLLLLAGYFVLRFFVLDVGTPGLNERESGFGFTRLSRDDLQATFGENPWPFYAYNVVASLLTVLVAEPSGGTFTVTQQVLRGDMQSRVVLSVLPSLSATAVITAYAWQRLSAWRVRDLTRDDRLVLIFVAVLGANAAISFPYTKDVVMSPAGMFMAVATFVSLRHFLALPPAPRVRRRIPVAVACAAVGALWAIEYVRVHTLLRQAARSTRIKWVYAEAVMPPTTPEADWRLFRRLRDEAVFERPGPPLLALPASILMYDE